MKKSRAIGIVIAVIVVALLGGVWVARSRMKGGSKPTIVRVEEVKRGDLVEFVSAPGEIEPKTKVEISARVVARVVRLPYKEGDQVTCGDPNANPPVPPSLLVCLDSKDLESQLRSAEAGRAAQEAQIAVEKARISSQRATLTGLGASLGQAKRDLQRQQELLATHDVSQSAFDQAKLKVDELQSQYDSSQHTLAAAELNLQVLQHNLEAADARIEQAKDALNYTTIRSPIDGVVTRINAEVGELVMTGTMNNPGTVIMEVGDLSQMLVVAQVAEADVGKVEVGQTATVHVDAYPDDEFKGVVESTALSNDMTYTRTKYYKTKILLGPAGGKLHSGMTAHVDIETRKHVSILKVPSQAVLAREVESLPLEIRDKNPEVDKDKTFATVVYRYGDGKALVTPVKIGQSDLTHTIIESGLKEGDKIMVGPYKELEKFKHDQAVQDEREVEAKKNKADKATPDVNEVKDANDGSKG